MRIRQENRIRHTPIINHYAYPLCLLCYQSHYKVLLQSTTDFFLKRACSSAICSSNWFRSLPLVFSSLLFPQGNLFIHLFLTNRTTKTAANTVLKIQSTIQVARALLVKINITFLKQQLLVKKQQSQVDGSIRLQFYW